MKNALARITDHDDEHAEARSPQRMTGLPVRYVSSPDTFRAAGQTIQNENGRWYVEDDVTHQVRYVGDGDSSQSYADCVIWLRWFRDGRP